MKKRARTLHRLTTKAQQHATRVPSHRNRGSRARSRAAKLGWSTRKANAAKRSRAAKKAAQTRAKNRQRTEPIDHLVTINFSAGARHYSRSLIVPAPRGTSRAKLLRQAKQEAPAALAHLIARVKLSAVEISRGPRTTRKRSEER